MISSYHDLWQVEQSFRMSKTDLRARPTFHHVKDSIEAHLTIVFTALAVAREGPGPHRSRHPSHDPAAPPLEVGHDRDQRHQSHLPARHPRQPTAPPGQDLGHQPVVH